MHITKIPALLLVFLAFLTINQPAYSQSGPGGVGSKDGSSSDLELWLQADKGVTTSNGNVTQWADSSGNGLDATTGTAPNFKSSGLNSQPTIEFDASNNEYLDLSSAVPTGSGGEITVFMVIKPSSQIDQNSDVGTVLANDGSNSNTGFVGLGDTLQGSSETLTFGRYNGSNDEGQYYDGNISNSFLIHNFDYDGSNANFYQDNSSQTLNAFASGFSSSESLKDLKRLGADAANNGHLDGEIAEIIIYSRQLTLSERNLVANYLDAKYQLGELTTTDFYPNSSTFRFDPIGIGYESTTDNVRLATRGGGLNLEDYNNSLATGDYFFFAHDDSTGIANSGSGSNHKRWAKTWKLEGQSIPNNSSRVRFEFNFNEYNVNINPTNGSKNDYVILESTGGDFTNPNSFNAQISTTDTSVQFDVKTNNISNGNYYTIGTQDPTATPLPVDFTSFQGQTKKAKNKLSWVTASETKAHYFDVQRSDKANKGFKAIGRVQASGTTTETNDYEFTDKDVDPITYYYRLKQVDFDGSYEYSKVIALEQDNDEKPFAFEVMNNPIHKGMPIRYNIKGAQNQTMTLFMRNVNGETQSQYTLSISNEIYQGSIQTSSLTRGIYWIILQTESGQQITRKLVIH